LWLPPGPSGVAAREPLQALPLFLKGYALYSSRLPPSVEAPFTAPAACDAPRIHSRVTISKASALALRGQRQLSANQANVTDIVVGKARHVPHPPAGEVAAVQSAHPVSDTGVSIDVRDIHVVHDVHAVIYIPPGAISAVISAAIPAVIGLVRS
jgi:hypothetical protein